MVRFVSARWVSAFVVLVVLGGAWFRLTSYGDLRLSIATVLPAFFADPIGVERHMAFASLLLRLQMRPGLLVLIDLAARPRQENAGT